MVENNPLKERCKKVLSMKNRADRRAEKISFGIWIVDQKEDDLIEWVKTLSYNELKIAMNCGLHGKSMTTAMLRLDEYKDHRDRIEREELTGEKPLSSEKPSLDPNKGLEQIDPDLILSMVDCSSEECLLDVSDWITATLTGKGKPDDPATG